MPRMGDPLRTSPHPQRPPPDIDVGFRGAGGNGTSSATDILTEDIDQAILHFSAAVKELNQPIITRTVLFINEVITSTAWRARRLREEEESVYHGLAGASGRGGQGGVLHGHSRGGVPSLTQWVDALESLTAAALPTALKYLRDLYQNATSWTQSDRRCSLAVLNLVFFTLVLCRQTQRRVGAVRQRQQRQRQQQQMRASTNAMSSGSTIAPFLFEGSSTAVPAPHLTAERKLLDTLEARVDSLYQAQQAIVVRYLLFIAWNAEAQLHNVKVRAAVSIKGMPLLSELPQVPLYLSEHDGWIWLWMTATLYSTLSLPRKGAPENAGGYGRTFRGSANTTTVGSPPPAATLRSGGVAGGGLNASATMMESGFALSTSASPLGRAESVSFSGVTATGAAGFGGGGDGSPSSSLPYRAGAASSVEDGTGGGASGPAAGKTLPVRSAVVRLLLQMSGHEGGDLYMLKIVSVLLSSYELFVHHWTRGQPVIGELFKEWTQRIVHSRLSPTTASLPRLHALFELILNGGLEELTRVVVTLDDVVVHTSFLFFSSTRPLLRLHQLLEQLVPLQVTLLLLYQLHPEAYGALAEALEDEDGETVADFRFPDEADDTHSSAVPSRRTADRRRRAHEACADAVLGYCTAVSQLLAHVAELLLEPHTQCVNGFNAFQLPQSLCSAMLKNTMMFMASEIMLNEDFWVSLRTGGGLQTGGGGGGFGGMSSTVGGGGGGGRDAARGGGSAMRRQWRWWAVWTNTAHFVCVTGGRFGEMEESDADLLFHQRRRDVFYVQAISLAMEDVYALLQMIASTETQSSPTAPRVLSLIFLRFRMFFVRLHEEHIAAINLHVVSPFSALRDDTFNAFAQLLEHYVAVTAMDTTAQLASSAPPPPHRSLWLLAVAYLRLATIDSSTIPDSEPTTTPATAAADPRSGEQLKDARLSARNHLLSTHNFVCATPFVSMFYLRDRSYESSEDWMQQPNKWRKNILSRNNTEVPQLRDSAHLFRCYRGEVQQTEDAARELLLLASVRLLTAALRSASRAQSAEEMERMNRSASSFTNLHPYSHAAESQPTIYVTAFSRYLCMLKDISSPCLFFLLQSIREELRGCVEREFSPRPSNASASPAGEGNWLGEQDLLDARAFELEVSLYSV